MIPASPHRWKRSLALAHVSRAEAARAPRVVEELLGDADWLAAMAAAMRSVAKPDAAEEIADELVSLAAASR